MSSRPLFRLQVLGPARVTRVAEPDAPSLLSQPRRLALLVYLCLARPRGFHSRDSLMALLWPDAGQDEGRHALRNALHGIRKALDPRVIVTEGDGLVAVDRAWISCDALEFEADLSAGRSEVALAGAPLRMMEGFHVSGSGEFEEWLGGERHRLDDLVFSAIRLLSESLERVGDVEGALTAARRACTLAPYDERSLRRLIELLDRRGERLAAVAAFQAFASRVEQELGVKPSSTVAALARDIGGRGQLARSGEGEASTTAPLPTSSSYIQYVRGTYLFLRAAHQGHMEDLDGSRALFEAALAKEPRFAQALAGLSNYYAVAAARNVLRPFDEVFGKAIALSHRALALDEGLAIPHVHFGVQAMYLEGDWDRAGREFRRAVSLDPSYAEARRFLGIWYDAMGRPAEALAELQEAVLLEPLIAMFRNSFASALMDRGKWAEAMRELERARELDPTYQAARERLIRCAEELGRLDRALEERERPPSIGDVAAFREALATDGAEGYFRVANEELRLQLPALEARARALPRSNPADRFAPPELRLAVIHARLGEHAAAREWEESACRATPSLRPWFRTRPELVQFSAGRGGGATRGLPRRGMEGHE